MARFTSTADLPPEIPLFPLPGALLLPRARLPLNIFEPRYLAMLDDVLKGATRLIGMIQPHDPRPADQTPELQSIGCAGRVISFTETDDGRYRITLGGISRFRVENLVEGFTPYRRAQVSWAGFDRDIAAPDADPGFDRTAFLDILGRYFEAVDLSSDWDSLRKADPELLINSLSMLCPFEPEEKQALLEAPDLTSRRETLVALMRFALAAAAAPDDGSVQ